MIRHLCIQLLTTALLFVSCKTGKLLVGEYYSGSLNRSTLRIDSSSFFLFTTDNVRLLVTGEHFFYTQGNWSMDKDTLILISSLDTSNSLKSKIYKIPSDNSLSTFVFFDNRGDTISFWRVDKNGKIYMARTHQNYHFIRDKIQMGDTMTFYFDFGYKPSTVVVEEKEPIIYHVMMNREFRPGYFKYNKFKVKKNRLKEVSSGDTYKRKKNGI